MQTDSIWFRSFGFQKAEIALVCLPYAGGGASIYREWGQHFPNVELIATELPGRESRLHEPPLTNLNEVTDALQEELTTLISDRPYALFGHSLGALLAFTLVRALRRDGHALPFCFFASGREAPTQKEPGCDLHDLPDAEFIDEMIRRYDGIPQVLLNEPDLLALFLPAMKADLCLTETYRFHPEPAFSFPIHILSGRNDHRLTQDLLMPWTQETTANAPLKLFDGGHFFIRDSQLTVINHIQSALDEALANA